jgi:hypothetical protein
MDAAFDLGSGFDPAKGCGVFIPVGRVAGDGPFQTSDAVAAEQFVFQGAWIRLWEGSGSKANAREISTTLL